MANNIHCREKRKLAFMVDAELIMGARANRSLVGQQEGRNIQCVVSVTSQHAFLLLHFLGLFALHFYPTLTPH